MRVTMLNNRLKSVLTHFSPTSPVTVPQSLKGRDHELKDALLFLLNGECIIVQGPRRIGKTSFLHCLGKLCSEQNLHRMYFSFQSLSEYNIAGFADHLKHKLSSELGIPHSHLDKIPGIYGSLKQLGQFLDNKHKPDERFVLFLDEFQLTEKFPENEQYLFYNQLRDVIEERVIHPELHRFVFVISTSQSLSELSTGVSSTLASSFPKTFGLGRISSDGCSELIRNPLGDIIEIEDRATDLIIRESGGHPYLLKLLLHALIIRNAADFSSGAASITLEAAQTQVNILTKDLTHPHFEMLQNILDEIEIQILYEIDKRQKLVFLDIREAASPYLARFSKGGKPSSVRIILDHLRNLQILRKENELFCFANGIYQKWFSGFFEQYYISEAVQEFRKLKSDRITSDSATVSSSDSFIQVIHEAILYLKRVFEEEGLWEIAWKDKNSGLTHHERYLQKMTAALLDIYLAPYDIIVGREVESGVGPMDIKLNLNRDIAACLEIKKSTGDVYQGLEVEMNAYMGSTVNIGFFVLFYTGGRTKLPTIMKKLDSILEKNLREQPHKAIRVICIDCIPKQSASKKKAGRKS